MIGDWEGVCVYVIAIPFLDWWSHESLPLQSLFHVIVFLCSNGDLDPFLRA